MPIQPPAFSVPALSPSSLGLGRSRDSGDGGFNAMLRLALQNEAQKQLQRRSQEFTREIEDQRHVRGQEDLFLEAINSGDLIPVDEAGTYLPGEETPEFNTIQGTGRFEGQEFVRQRDILEARAEQMRETPFEQEGLVAEEGVTEGDVYNINIGPGGNLIRQPISGSVFNSLIGREGAKEELLGLIDSIPEGLGPTYEAAQSLRQAIEAQDVVSFAEENQYRELGVSLEAFESYPETISRLQTLDEQRLARHSAARLQAYERWQIRDPESGRIRNLNPAELEVLGMANAGLRGSDAWTPQNERLYNAIGTQFDIVPRQTAPDINEQVMSSYTGMAVPGSDANLWGVSVIRGLVANQQNPELEQAIRDAGNTPDDATSVRRWLSKPEATKFRAALSLFQHGISRRSQIQERMNAGWIPPFEPSGENGAYRGFEILYGDAFNDVTPRNTRRGPASGATGEEEEARQGEALSFFEPLRAGFEGLLNTTPGVQLNQFDQTLRSAPLSEVGQTLSSTAQSLRQAGGTENEKLAEYLELVSTMNEVDLQEWVDSVAVPTLDSVRSR